MTTVHPSAILLCPVESPHLKQAPISAGIPLNSEDPCFLSEPWYAIKINNFKSNLCGNESRQENLRRSFLTCNSILLLESSISQGRALLRDAGLLHSPGLAAVGHLTCLGPIFPITKIIYFLYFVFFMFSIYIEKESTLKSTAISDKITRPKPLRTLHPPLGQPGCSSTTALAPPHIPSGGRRTDYICIDEPLL